MNYSDRDREVFCRPSDQIRRGCLMPRPRQRVCLEQGLKLDLNKLARQGLVSPGAKVGPNFIRWWNTYWDEEIAKGLVGASMEGEYEGWFRIQIGSLDQTITSYRRHAISGGGSGISCAP